MKTYLLHEDQIDQYYNNILDNNVSSINEAKLKIAILGIEELDLEEAKKKANIGDCLLFIYKNRILPFQVIHKYEDGRCVMSSYYVVENHIFDNNTNVWKDAEIRRFLNEDVANELDPELLQNIKETEVHTDDYVTKDKIWLLSHEEVGYNDKDNMFKKNNGAITFDYYKDNKLKTI